MLRPEQEIRDMRNTFEKNYDEDVDDEELDAILAALNWALSANEELLQYLPD